MMTTIIKKNYVSQLDWNKGSASVSPWNFPGFELHNVAMDGKCLCSAIAPLLNVISIERVCPTASAVRAKIVDFMRMHVKKCFIITLAIFNLIHSWFVWNYIDNIIELMDQFYIQISINCPHLIKKIMQTDSLNYQNLVSFMGRSPPDSPPGVLPLDPTGGKAPRPPL